ncbi:MAG: YebC/PmpR family DNA-binding transcriptional regulator [Deltaproteobacteria bacterium]|nr:YebC/PmpR family DNA-binding transcriptional regulator [Deltaproteobacteria bacterium]
MSGHSKWATIKRKKGVIDAARGNLWTKVIREITTAARLGGGSPDANPRLRLALDKAKAANMPRDNVERAIKKGTGELEGVSYEELVFEGYGPAGVALYVEIMTDNRNRTSAELRTLFAKGGGNIGASGSVAYMFNKKGQFVFDASKHSEDQVMEVALDAGADDVKTEGSRVVVLSTPDAFEGLKKAFEAKKLAFEGEITRVADTNVKLKGADAEKVLNLIQLLEENDDVQNVYANVDIDEADL